MPDSSDPNTTHVLENLFVTLRGYSQTRRTTDSDILRERARQYAEVPPQREELNETESITVLMVRLGDETYGLNVMHVTSVRALPTITRVPNAPTFYKGVVNVRGAVITVLDLRTFFGLSPVLTNSELVVLSNGHLTLGVDVGWVLGVKTIPRDQMRGLEDSQYALGTYHGGGVNAVILDMDSILNDVRLMGITENKP